MIYAFDTHYQENKAKTVCIGFDKWEDIGFLISKSLLTDIKSDYISGEFYKRELPCIIELLAQIDLKNEDIIIIDGFVFLDDQMKPGLGAHLYHIMKTTGKFTETSHYQKDISTLISF
jgi:exodeoxyribonuclease-5/deoxyribonuclease V